MEINKTKLTLIIILTAIIFLLLGMWLGQQYLIQEFRDSGINNLCKLLI